MNRQKDFILLINQWGYQADVVTCSKENLKEQTHLQIRNIETKVQMGWSWLFHRGRREINCTYTGQDTICTSIDKNYFAPYLQFTQFHCSETLESDNPGSVLESSDNTRFSGETQICLLQEKIIFCWQLISLSVFLETQVDPRLTLQPLGFHIRFFLILFLHKM